MKIEAGTITNNKPSKLFIMEEKFNESTINRPEGDRILDADVVSIDIAKHVLQITSEDGWMKNDKNAITVFKSAELRIVLVALHQFAEMRPPTPSEGVTSVQVLEGAIKLMVETQTTEAKKGQLVAFHKHLPFQLTATEDSIILMTMTGDAE